MAAGHRHAWFLQADHQTGKAGGRLPALLVAKRRGACRRARTRRALHPGLSWAGGLAMHDAHQAFRAGAQSAPWTSLEAAVASPRRRGCWLSGCRVLRERAFRGEGGGRSLPATVCRNLRYFLSPSTNRFEA